MNGTAKNMPKTDSLKNIIFVRLNFLVQRLVQRKKEILLLITVSVFCFLVLEIVARSIIKEKKNSWYGYPPGLFLPDDTKGFVYKPHFKGLFPNEPFTDISININSKGLRDVEHEYEKCSPDRNPVRGNHQILMIFLCNT